MHLKATLAAAILGLALSAQAQTPATTARVTAH